MARVQITVSLGIETYQKLKKEAIKISPLGRELIEKWVAENIKDE